MINLDLHTIIRDRNRVYSYPRAKDCESPLPQVFTKRYLRFLQPPFRPRPVDDGNLTPPRHEAVDGGVGLGELSVAVTAGVQGTRDRVFPKYHAVAYEFLLRALVAPSSIS